MNKREQGQEYRIQVLQTLARLGYASTRQLARMVWRGCDGSSRKMCGRTLRWLLARRYIVTRRDGDSVNGEQLAAVTVAGASWLAELGDPLPAGKAHARDWLRHAHSHRTAANSVYAAAAGLLPDTGAWSELEIRAGLAPLEKLAYRFEDAVHWKIPDVLLELPAGLAWVEVENAWRGANDLAKMVASMRVMEADKRIAEAHFVITSPAARTIGARLRKALTHGPDSGWPRQVKERDARILTQRLKVFTLDRETLELSPVAF
jgi:hypothetical protein